MSGMDTKFTIGQKVFVDIWCCGKKAPATVCEIGKFIVTVDCHECGQKHGVGDDQLKPRLK